VTVLPILTIGHDVLHSPAQAVTEVTNELRSLAADMVDTMHAAPGVGLAAPQVGVSVQMFVWHYDDGEISEGVVVNPTLTLKGPWRNRFSGEPAEEGCLSVPGLRFPLARAEQVILRGQDLEGKPVTINAEGWLARIFQHENDHLRGVLYRDRLRRRWRKHADREIAESELLKLPNSWHPERDGSESELAGD